MRCSFASGHPSCAQLSSIDEIDHGRDRYHRSIITPEVVVLDAAGTTT